MAYCCLRKSTPFEAEGSTKKVFKNLVTPQRKHVPPLQR
jgi:hypothetical protein